MIEQSTGVISERAGADLAEALSRLRGYARNHNLSLTDVALSAAPIMTSGRQRGGFCWAGRVPDAATTLADRTRR